MIPALMLQIFPVTAKDKCCHGKLSLLVTVCGDRPLTIYGYHLLHTT